MDICVPRELGLTLQPVSPQEFRRLLRDRDVDSLLVLVRALWTARGYDCRSVDDAVEATDPRTGGSERIAVTVGGLFGPSVSAERADVVIATRDTDAVRRAVRDRSATFVGPDRLREMLLYGVDVDSRRRLFRVHFNRDPVESEDGDGRWSGWSAGGADRLVAAAVLLALVAVLVSGAWADADRAPAAVGTRTPAEPTAATTPTQPSRQTGLPPGVNRSGVSDVTVLAGAHGKAIRNRSYRLTFTRRITSPDNGTGTRVQEGFRRISVNDTMRFRTQSGGNVSISEGGFGSLSVGVYGDGRKVYRRVQRGNESVFLTGPTMRSGRFSNQVQRHVIVYLSTNETSLWERPGQGEYAVRATGTPTLLSGPVENYSAVAVVQSDGFVRSLNVSYDRTRDGEVERVRFGFAYEEVGGVAVRPPSWYDRARNATAESS